MQLLHKHFALRQSCRC